MLRWSSPGATTPSWPLTLRRVSPSPLLRSRTRTLSTAPKAPTPPQTKAPMRLQRADERAHAEAEVQAAAHGYGPVLAESRLQADDLLVEVLADMLVARRVDEPRVPQHRAEYGADREPQRLPRPRLESALRGAVQHLELEQLLGKHITENTSPSRTYRPSYFGGTRSIRLSGGHSMKNVYRRRSGSGRCPIAPVRSPSSRNRHRTHEVGRISMVDGRRGGLPLITHAVILLG